MLSLHHLDMEKPQVRLIEDQKIETKPIEVSGWEAEQLLRKYGHQPQQFSSIQEPQISNQDNNLTFEEMLSQQESKRKQEEERRKQKIYGPKPTTFNTNAGYDSEIKYGSDEDTGFNFKIEITTDMKLPKY